MIKKVGKIYPHFTVANNKKPNRLYAFPFFGLLVKLIMLLPVMIVMCILSIYAFFIYLANWFYISFTGKYWEYAYKLFLGLMRLSGKMQLFIFGITDTYPGFGLDTKGLFELNIPKPEKINIWLAIPLVGVFVRIILLIPYFIFNDVLQRGAQVAMVFSWFTVTFKSEFPDSLYEFERDSMRVSFASSTYLLGLVDRYPSFSISMNHKNVKIGLIIVGAILALGNMSNSYGRQTHEMQRNNYQYQAPPQPMQRSNSY